MRNILTSVVLVVLLFPALALGGELTVFDLVERGGVYYKKYSDVPFTGKVTGRIQGSFKNGRADGNWFWYYEDGQLQQKGSFKDGKDEGPKVFYFGNGQVSWKGTFKGGELNGPWVGYWDNGQLKSKGTRKNGKKIGTWIAYNKDGTADDRETGTFESGVKISD